MQLKPARAARLLFQLPRESRVFCAIQPSNQWGWAEALANKANHLLEVLSWQNTKDAQKKRPMKAPKPYVPDFMINKEETTQLNRGSTAQDVESIKTLLNRPRV